MGGAAIDLNVGLDIEGDATTPKVVHSASDGSTNGFHIPEDVGGGTAGAERAGVLTLKAEISEAAFAAEMANNGTAASKAWWSARSAADKHRHFLVFAGARTLVEKWYDEIQ